MAAVRESLSFFAGGVEVIELPAWDCLPYDRVSPKSDIVASRIDALTKFVDATAMQPRIILTSVAALLQKVPARQTFEGASKAFGKGAETSRDRLLEFLLQNGYGRCETVMEPGEYAIRGGIIDLFPPGFEEPLRLDFFGDDLDGIRRFEPFSQRTTGEAKSFNLKPVSEISLDEDAISRFRTAYRALFGAVSSEDPLYEAISEGHTQAGMEHWLPLFHEELETVLDYLPDAVIAFDHQADEASDARWELIGECYDARADMKARGLAVSETTYNPLPVDRLYLTKKELKAALKDRKQLNLQPFSAPESDGVSSDAGGKLGRDFADARALPDVNVYDALREHILDEAKAGRGIVIGAFSEGSAERLLGILKEHDIAASSDASAPVRMAVLELEHGFTAPGLALITEQDILGDRLSSPQRRKIRPENFIAETSVLNAGDLVVHAEHGIGRYDELVTLDVTGAGAPHDCLLLIYDGGDKLFLPVENIEVISRYGEGSETIRLDKLGGVAWQARKSQLKQRIRDMADQLIAVAAARELKKGEVFEPQSGVYDEFCSSFQFTETDDQERAIGDVVKDLSSGRPMDRLICGDVGFGKTEVALRATFVAALEGKQVAIVVPTTLLARQHYRVFEERFVDFPVQVRQLSRLVSKKDADATKAGLETGQVDIVIGTHALLAKSIKFDRLGLLIIDEEQHFGVAHKEQLKSMKNNVHVLTLTATPIPRTLQLALTGVRELSLITTPPVDRLAVRTFVLPYDPVVVREAILRERYRGGQIFYVCPRVADLGRAEEELQELVPDLRIAMAHGQMSPGKLEDVMSAFYDGKYDLLLATNIVESGLDLPSVNTIILHRADMFGLAQLYQLRGRIGRSKVRGYAYLTLPPKRKLSAAAQKRLEVMQALDTLGAGFTLASHDLDIRGAGNLLGDEQSGHIKSVGDIEDEIAEKWSPQIDIGIPVLIPNDYVPDLGVRLSLYRRIADLTDRTEIDAFAAEMIDRFGSLPAEVENLLETVAIKRLCLEAGIEKVEAGPKGAVITFRNNEFSNLEGLVTFITSQVGTSKLRPDHKLVFMRSWNDAPARLGGVQYLMKELADIAA
jgi:transcription-repair coupling factor (superfamily II helicase)